MTKLFGCCCLRRNKTNKVKEEEEVVLFGEEKPPQEVVKTNGILKDENPAEPAQELESEKSEKTEPTVNSQKPLVVSEKEAVAEAASEEAVTDDKPAAEAEEEGVTDDKPAAEAEEEGVTRKLSINPGDEVISQHPQTFVQLSGHEGHFHVAGPGSIWKQQAKDGEVEAKVLKELNEDSLHAYVPDFMGEKEHNGKKYIGMEDLMSHFTDGCGMDIKMGTRTFKESEVKNQTLRQDLYEKMINLDPREPSEQEHRDRAITKLRYMTFRERESSSQTLGFRVEAMKVKGGAPNKDFKKLKHKQEVKNALLQYFNPLSKSGVEGFIAELTNLNGLLKESTFFKEHEFIGTSLLFIYDDHKVGVWLIDFGKTTPIRELVPGGMITHEKDWELGNYEDGYFTGMDSVIQILTEIYDEKEEDAAQSTTIRVH